MEQLHIEKEKMFNLMESIGFSEFLIKANRIVIDRYIEFLDDHIYTERDYELARKNTTYNEEGRAVIPKDDEWLEETEWDDLFEELKKEREEEIRKIAKYIRGVKK